MNTNFKWGAEPPASVDAIKRLVEGSPFELPADYLDLLKSSNGGEGEIFIDPGWLVLWRAEDVNQWNVDYEVPKWCPGFWGFGGNGGGELLAFDFRSTPSPVVMMPLIGMDPKEAIMISPSFTAFMSVALSTEH